jgi:hypothetical protein
LEYQVKFWYALSMNISNKKLVYGLATIAVILLIAVGYTLKNNSNKLEENIPSSAEDQDQRILDTLKNKTTAINGTFAEAENVQRPFAVVIENHPDARPQSGLSQADLVYEALAEGGITRQLAVFQSQKVDAIGPVRSARTYFNDWAQEWGAIYTHVGGNVAALDLIKQGIPGVSDADQFYNGDYFTRISSRVAPHNTYTSTDKLKALAQAHNYSMQKTYGEYMFKDDAATTQPSVTKINLDFSLSQFAVRWVYDVKTNSYQRFLAGSAAVDAGNKQNIIAKNVIVQRVKAQEAIPGDPKLVLKMATHEGGVADVYQDGQVIHGTWRYINGKTRFYDSIGKEIPLNRGQIWIEVIPPDRTVAAE